MSVTVLASLAINDQELQWVKGMLLKVIAEALGKIEGFEAGELFENQDDPNNLIIWQQFATRGHYLAYMNSAADYYPEADTKRYLASFLRPPDIRFYDKIGG
jgi:hypothetical protein